MNKETYKAKTAEQLRLKVYSILDNCENWDNKSSEKERELWENIHSNLETLSFYYETLGHKIWKH